MPRTPTRRLWVIFFLCGFVFLYFYPSGEAKTAPTKNQSTVVQEVLVVKRVIDGDTLVLSNGEKARLTGIDTPETRENSKAIKDSQRSGEDIKNITQQGIRAKQFVQDLTQDKTVRIEYDVQKRDRYGRLLVYAYDIETLKRNPKAMLTDGLVISGNQEIFLNGSIIRSGYAVPLTVPPNVKHADLFKELYSEARSNKRGLWASQ